MDNPRSVLIVEDEPLISELYRAVLSTGPYKVLTAFNKQTAVELITQYRPHLILLDLMIPIGPGEELVTYDHPVGFDIVEWVRDHPELGKTKILVLTNLDSDMHKTHAEQLGVADYLMKVSLEPKELARKVDSIMKAK